MELLRTARGRAPGGHGRTPPPGTEFFCGEGAGWRRVPILLPGSKPAARPGAVAAAGAVVPGRRRRHRPVVGEPTHRPAGPAAVTLWCAPERYRRVPWHTVWAACPLHKRNAFPATRPTVVWNAPGFVFPPLPRTAPIPSSLSSSGRLSLRNRVFFWLAPPDSLARSLPEQPCTPLQTLRRDRTRAGGGGGGVVGSMDPPGPLQPQAPPPPAGRSPREAAVAGALALLAETSPTRGLPVSGGGGGAMVLSPGIAGMRVGPPEFFF